MTTAPTRPAASRRAVYRRSKRALLDLLATRWHGPRRTLEPAVRRFLAGMSRRQLSRLAGDRRLALAAVTALLASSAAVMADPPVELADVAAGTGGFVINGIDVGDRSGYSVSGAGDVNGDGLDDLIVGADLADPGGDNDAGESYVVFGKAGTAAVELSDVAAGTGGFVINGIDTNDASGRSVSGAGDVNGDGLDDLIVGAVGGDPGGDLDAGESYVVFGKADTAAVDLATVNAGVGGGFVIRGIDGLDLSGVSVSGAGDVNGDGLADLIVGLLADPGGDSNAGESYVVFGKADAAAVELTFVALGVGGFVINGIDPHDYSGGSVSGAGDVNGDGLDDLIVGAYGAAGTPAPPGGGSGGGGGSYVVFGKADTAAVELSAVAAGTGGFVINGIDPYDYSGRSVSGAGDVNGDGLDDLIVGAHYAAPGGDFLVGESYVVFGKADTAAVELAAVAGGTGGFVMNGIDGGDLSGFSVSGAGDVDGDGLDDLIVGAPGYAGYPTSGESYVVFGKADTAAVELSAVAAGAGGFVINGIDVGDRSGGSVSGAGDVNGDGLDDLIVGAPFAEPDGDFIAGESYVVFASNDCEYRIDDGSGAQASVIGAGVLRCWANALHATDGCEEIGAVEVAFGDVPPSTPLQVWVYEDPNDDGDPSDAVLLGSKIGLSASENTDTFTEFVLDTPVTVDGTFFAAVSLTVANAEPARTDGAPDRGLSWFSTNGMQADPLPTGGIGAYPGNFMIRATGPRGSVACAPDCVASLDDGSAEQSIGLIGGGDMFWFNALNATEGCDTICAIQSAYIAFPPQSPVRLFIYDDPTDDGDPSDAVLLAGPLPAVTANEGGDVLETHVIDPPVTVSGRYFVGVAALHADGEFPAAQDLDTDLIESWAAFGFTDANNPLDGTGTVATISSFDLPGNWMLRALGPQEAYCALADCDDGTVTGTPDGSTNVSDLLGVLAEWNTDTFCDVDDGTVTGTPDGDVNVSDLLFVLALWGDCPVAANDECVSALAIGPTVVPLDLKAATQSGQTVCLAGGPDVWFCFTAPADGTVTLQTSFATNISVYDGCACGPPLPPVLDCQYGPVTLALTSGQQVLVRVTDYLGLEDNQLKGALIVGFAADPPPAAAAEGGGSAKRRPPARREGGGPIGSVE